MDSTGYEGRVWFVQLWEGEKCHEYITVAPHLMGSHEAAARATHKHCSDKGGGVDATFIFVASPLKPEPEPPDT